jgi:hypothetical protein
MAIAQRNFWANATPASPLTINVSGAPGVAADDYLIGAFNTDTPSGAFTVPSPLTKVNEIALTVDNAMCAQAHGRATGSETNLSTTNASDTLVGLIVGFSGVDTTTANDATPVALFSNTSGVAARTVAITTVSANCMLVVAISYDTQGTTDPTPTISDTAGGTWTIRNSFESGGFRKTTIAYALKASIGATTVSITPAFSTGVAATLFALREASGGGGDVLMAQACL